MVSSERIEIILNFQLLQITTIWSAEITVQSNRKKTEILSKTRVAPEAFLLKRIWRINIHQLHFVTNAIAQFSRVPGPIMGKVPFAIHLWSGFQLEIRTELSGRFSSMIQANRTPSAGKFGNEVQQLRYQP